MKRAIGYVRVSGSKQEDGYSLPDQKAKIEDLCRARGHQLLEIVEDVHTGKELDERPAMTAIRERMRAKEFDVLVVWSLDRFSRNQNHVAVLMYQLEKYGVDLELANGDQITDDPMGKFVLAAKALMAELEWENIRERTWNGLRRRALSGKMPAQSRPAYGYKWGDAEKTCWAIHETTAPIASRIYGEAASGITLRRIAQALTLEGIPTPSDQWLIDHGEPSLHRDWTIGTIDYILTNPAYLGQYTAFTTHHYKEKVFDEMTGRVRTVVKTEKLDASDPRCIELKGVCPKIIDPAFVKIVQERLAHNKDKASRNTRYPTGTLLRGGFAVCGSCGRKMSQNQWSKGRKANPRTGLPYFMYVCPSYHYTSRQCSNIAGAIWIDDTVWRALQDLILHHKDYRKGLEERRSQRSNAQDSGEAYRKELERIEVERKNIAKLIQEEDDEGIRAYHRLRAKELTTREKDLHKSLADLADTEASERLERVKLDNLAAWCESVRQDVERAGELTYEQKRFALYSFRIRVKVHPKECEQRLEIFAGGEKISEAAGGNDGPIVFSRGWTTEHNKPGNIWPYPLHYEHGSWYFAEEKLCVRP